jgi:hypothetical protein
LLLYVTYAIDTAPLNDTETTKTTFLHDKYSSIIFSWALTCAKVFGKIRVIEESKTVISDAGLESSGRIAIRE